MCMKILLTLLPVFIISLSINSYAQDMDEDLIGGSFTDKLWVGANVGVSEPWGDPGTGGFYVTGFALKSFGQYDLSDKVNNLIFELSIGFSTWAAYSGNGSATVIPILVNGVYKLTDIMPEISVFMYGGIGFNLHSWDTDFDDSDIVSQSNLGINLGIGGSYPINPQFDLNLRVGYYLSFISSRETDGSKVDKDYGHSESPIMLGVTYKL